MANGWPEVIGTKTIIVDGKPHKVTVYAPEHRHTSPRQRISRRNGTSQTGQEMLTELAELRRKLAEIAKHA